MTTYERAAVGPSCSAMVRWATSRPGRARWRHSHAALESLFVGATELEWCWLALALALAARRAAPDAAPGAAPAAKCAEGKRRRRRRSCSTTTTVFGRMMMMMSGRRALGGEAAAAAERTHLAVAREPRF